MIASPSFELLFKSTRLLLIITLLKQVVADCDESIVLLLQERAKATQMLAELRGAGTGVASAELSAEELDRIKRANTPNQDESVRLNGDAHMPKRDALFKCWTSAHDAVL